MTSTSAILLAGGTGTRIQSQIPKQYLELENKLIAFYSLDVFNEMPEIDEIIIVCDPQYQSYFTSYLIQPKKRLKFAQPGKRRQDSLFNGFQKSDPKSDLICIHDAARPFITPSLVQRVLDAAKKHGAATVGMPIKFTVKETQENLFVKQTPNRSFIWEIQTPQVLRPHLLTKGFEIAIEKGLTVTDDVSLAELIPHPVKLVEGCHANIKITTPEDFLLAQHMSKKV